MNQVGAHIVVSGLVQGVGFRYYCLRNAAQLGLTGWVRNQPDGSVAVHAEGNRGQIEALIEVLKVGPRNAAVRDLQIRWEVYTGKYSSFSLAH